MKQSTHRRVIPSIVPLKISFEVASYTLGSSFISMARFSAIVMHIIVIIKRRNRNLNNIKVIKDSVYNVRKVSILIIL